MKYFFLHILPFFAKIKYFDKNHIFSKYFQIFANIFSIFWYFFNIVRNVTVRSAERSRVRKLVLVDELPDVTKKVCHKLARSRSRPW